jgi:hypothetical protein
MATSIGLCAIAAALMISVYKAAKDHPADDNSLSENLPERSNSHYGQERRIDERRRREAIKRGIPWMIQAAEPYESPRVRGKQAKKMPERLKNELLAMFLEKAHDEDTDFNSLCQVMKILVEQGVQDEKALSIVRKRFASEGDHYAAWVLHKAGHSEDVTLFIEKVRQVYAAGAADPARHFGLSDLHNWLAFIPDEDEQYAGLLREGLKSPNADVRDSAYYFLDSAPFPAGERTAFVHSGLSDPSARVRYWATRYFDKEEMSDRDWELLGIAAEQEKDESNLKEMREVLAKQQERRTSRHMTTPGPF